MPSKYSAAVDEPKRVPVPANDPVEETGKPTKPTPDKSATK
jgi:hypothetical protein